MGSYQTGRTVRGFKRLERISFCTFNCNRDPRMANQRHSQKKIKPTALLYDVRKSVSEILEKPFTERIDHQVFKPDQKLLALWAADCAEHVLPYFEEKRCNDYRPRKAIEVCRGWARTGVFSMAVIRKASMHMQLLRG